MWRSFKTLMAASWEATAGDRVRFFGFILLSIVAYTIDLAVPWAIGWTLGIFVRDGFTETSLQQGGVGISYYVGLKMAYVLLHHYARYLQGTAAYHARFQKLEEVFRAMLSFPLKWHVANHSGENLSRLHRSVGAVESVISNYLWQFIDGAVKFGFASVALFALDTMVASTVLLMGALTVLVMIMFNSRLTRNIRKNNRFYDKLNRTCVDYLFNIITVKTLRLEEPAVKYLTDQRDAGMRICRKIWKYQELKWGTIAVGYSLVMGTSLLIYFNNHRGIGGAFDVAQVYVLLNYLDRIFGAISSFTGYYGGIIEAATAYDDASAVLEDAKRRLAPPRPSRIPRDWKSLSVSDLHFSYNGDTPNLNGVSVPLRRGEKIALVGPSGGGKSTLLKVLGGMLEVTSAAVSVRGVEGEFDLDDISIVSLLVPQEPEIFSETVRYNMTLGQSFTDNQLDRAIEICRIGYLLEKLPKGWESNLEESGLNISVGERQRLALARGLLRASNKDLLLLDEPTSSLDPMTEKQIFHGILHQFAEVTVMTACHRLALVPLFDTIIYVRNGQIEERGSFEELRSAGGPFSIAWADYEKTIVHREAAPA